MRRASTATAGALLAAFLVAGCASSGPGSPTESTTADASFEDIEPITLTLSDLNVESASSAIALRAFADEIEKNTDGKVTMEFYWGSSLVPVTEGLTSVASGIVDIQASATAYFPQELPVANWFASVGTTNHSTAWPVGFLASMPAMIEQFETNEDLRAEFAELGVVPLLAATGPSQDMLCTKPVETPAEASGTLIRTAGQPWLGEAEALGMTQVTLAPTDVYEGMQRGVVECAVSVPSTGFMPNGLWDIAKHYVPLGMSGTAGFFYIMNKDLWDSLPEQVRDVINKAKPIYTRTYMEETLKGYAAWGTEAPDQGVEFHDGSQLREVIAEHREELRTGLVDNAPTGVSDPQGAYDAYVASLEEWLSAAEDDFDIAAEPLPDDAEEMVKTYEAAAELDWDAYDERLHAQSEVFAK